MNKKVTILLCAAALATGAATGAFAASQSYTAGAGVNASPHNINRIVSGADAYDTGATDGRTCAYCHTPHHAIVDPDIASYNPLWSHELTNGTFTGYKSPTLTAGALAAASDPLIGPSRLCMSCHDGVIAVDQHYGSAIKNIVKNSGDTWGGIDVGDAEGTTLTNDHPIGFDFDVAATNDKNGGVYNGIFPGTRKFSVTIPGAGAKGIGSNPVADSAATNMFATAGGATIDRLIGDLMWSDGASTPKSYMTCASCHDVHNKENPEGYLLINVQKESKICLTCHNK